MKVFSFIKMVLNAQNKGFHLTHVLNHTFHSLVSNAKELI